MAERRSISVSWHDASRQFVKWVGYSRGKDGKLRPKCHYLGNNKSNAVAMQLHSDQEIMDALRRGDMWFVMNELKFCAACFNAVCYKHITRMLDAYLSSHTTRVRFTDEEAREWKGLVLRVLAGSDEAIQDLHESVVAFWNRYISGA